MARAQHNPRTYTTKYGERLNAVFSTPAGEEVTVWSPLNYEPLTALKRGDRVQLARDHKGSHRLVENSTVVENSQNGKTDPTGNGWTSEQKKAIAKKVEQDADLLAYCYSTAQSRFGDLSDESIRCLATTLFIEAIR